jgi:hypothetical protein
MMESTSVNESEWPRLDGLPVEEPHDDWELLGADADPANERQPEKVVVVETHPARKLRHSASSPDLRHIHFLEDAGEDTAEENASSKDDGSSFAMVSGPKSIVSFSSTTISFRDAIMKGNKEGKAEEEPVAPLPVKQRRVKPKFVVKPIKRCTKSTGDLLGMIHEGEDDVLGDTDAMDFYHRKAAGAKNRTSGLRMRPDEAKRKAFTMSKKAMQRGQKA